MYGSCFVLANYSLWCYARPSPHGCQFQKASWLWVGLCVCFPPSMLGFCLVWAGLVCARSVFVSSYVFQSYWVLKTLTISLELSTISGSYHLPTSSPGETPEPWGETLDKDISFRTECFKVSCSLKVVPLWSSLLTTIYCKKKFLWWGLSDTLIYRDSCMSLEVTLLLCFLNRIRVVSFSLSPWPI